jgi:hypothetical protein
MGRPLNKKYFGNRNQGTNGYQTTQHGASNNTDPGGEVINGDDHIGGEGIANINVPIGSRGNYINRLPTFASFGDPTIANGVRAQTVLHSVAQSASPAADGINYWVGDVITDANGSTWRVTELELFSATKTNSGSGYGADDNIPYANGVIINVDGISGGGSYGPITGYNISNRGSFTTTGAPPAVSGTQGGTLGGSGAAFSFVWRIKTLAVVSSHDYSYALRNSYDYGTDNTTTGGHGTGAALNVGFSPDHLEVTEKGSGYTGAESITISTAPNPGETRATGVTFVLTADTGAVGSATNQENAIIAYVYMDGSIQEADIVRQVSTDRYRINTTETGNNDAAWFTAKLKTTLVASGDDVSDYGNMWKTKMNIWAFDEYGDSYLVKKLTAHKAVVYPFACARLSKAAGEVFAPGQAVPWKFFEGQATAIAGYVKIENA